MKKKLAAVLIILICSALLFVIGGALILVFAPGTEIFGIRYVSYGDSNCEVTEPLTEFSGAKIYVSTNSVPININFTEYYSSEVKFSQKFVGFTRSGFNEAGLNVYTDEEKNLHIETKELVKWIYAQESDDFFSFTLTLPKSTMTGKSLYITSGSSPVVVNGGATLTNFSMVSEGGLTIQEGTNITAHNFKYHTEKLINIDDKINAVNLDLKSTSSSVLVKKEILGDLIAKTKGGNVEFISCKNLNVETGAGSIRPYGEGLTSVKGNVLINTDGGSVLLGSICLEEQNAECKITSETGSVSITNMTDGDIIAWRGNVTIEQARAVVIQTRVGDVVVDNVTNGIEVMGRNGNVELGNRGSVSNVKVYTTTGKIDVKNAHGVVNLESVSNAVKLENGSSEDITIKADRGVSAEGLKGKVLVDADGDINLKFSYISGNVTVVTGTKTDEVNIDAGETSYLDVDYNIVSSKGTIAKVYVGEELLDENSKLDSGIHEGKHLIKVKTSYANVVLKLIK